MMSAGIALFVEGGIPVAAPDVWLGLVRLNLATPAPVRRALSWFGMVAGLVLLWLAYLLLDFRWPKELPAVSAALFGIGLVLVLEGLFLRATTVWGEKVAGWIADATEHGVRRTGLILCGIGILVIIAGSERLGGA